MKLISVLVIAAGFAQVTNAEVVKFPMQDMASKFGVIEQNAGECSLSVPDNSSRLSFTLTTEAS